MSKDQALRRINHLYQWLEPEEAKKWLQGSDINLESNLTQRKTNIKSKVTPESLFPTEQEIFDMLNDEQEFELENAGPIRNLNDQDLKNIYNTLSKSNIDITPWDHLFSHIKRTL
jgi:hypothetical protein